MPKHEYFEELAVVAVLGKLAPLQVEELSLHLANCTQCRKVHDEFVELHAHKQPITPEMDAIIAERREPTKTTVLQAVAERRAQRTAQTGRVDHSTPVAVRSDAFRLMWTGLLAASAAGLIFFLGTRFDRYLLSTARFEQTMQSRGAVPPMQMLVPPQITSETSKDKMPDDQSVQLAKELQAEKQDRLKLEALLADKTQALNESQNDRASLQQQLDAQAQEIRVTASSLATKTEELSKAEAAKNDHMNTIVALRYQVQDLTEKLDSQKDSLDREKQLLASGRDVRDIIGARNLHIIDVYDRGPQGDLKKSFARAFYTEGKSLIFYAYDLPSSGGLDNGKFAYTAWGESNGNKKTIRNLGILLNDDKGQRRWVLNFSDPKVLAEIDSVFVTLERTDSENEQPKGTRMLTAYLDSRVNHP